MPVCKCGDININYEIYGEGFPLVLSHGFTASLAIWAPQIEAFSAKYQLIVYDARGHGLSSAPAGDQNYTLDSMVEDLHHLMTYLGVKKAYIGGLSMGGATSLGYAYRHPEIAKALLVFDIHGGFQPRDPQTQGFFATMHEESAKIARQNGMADLARHQIEVGGAFRPILLDKALQARYIEDMARCPVNGYIGVGRAQPWQTEWQRKAADSINVPALIIVGGDDEFTLTGARILHQHIRGSRYVEIGGSVHGTAQWYPQIFNRCVLDFLAAVEEGKPVAGETIIK
jgi:pimeloyl-ACP methyl ester carboxylesterase